MSNETELDRRSYLKQSAVTVATVGGIVGATQSAAASTKTATISGTGDYVINTDDPRKIFRGSVSGGSEEIEFDHYITSALLDGDLEVDVRNVENVANVGDYVEVSGTDISYSFAMTNDNISMESDCESSENATDTGTAWGKLGWSDADTFQVSGTIQFLKSYNSGGIKFAHTD